ncbi:MAG: type II toxin-antitoxin system VapC family toxin [Thermomicrobia bacterium]|nr:type II toxin-antitoxin system VapC family toxin [Thermomicrobia bacterium]MCA1725000.1 type II toxin-antitoxin system VapC family toxin [Thermomicrobia bacterium]
MSNTVNVVVVDASVAVKWVLTEDGTAEARSLLAHWVSARLQPIAPSWFACEVANVVYRQMRMGTITLDRAKNALDAVLGIVALRDTLRSDAVRAIEMADTARQQTPYDACYLALAEREQCEYWTDDARFVKAAGSYFPQVKHLSDL